MKIPSIAKLSIFTILAISLAASAALAAGTEPTPESAAKEEKKSGTGKYYGAGVAATSAATAYATRPDRIFRNSAEAQPLSEEQLKLIKDEVQKSIDAGNNSKSIISGKRPVVVLSLSDKVPDELSLIERIRIKLLGGKEIRSIDPLRDAKAEEMKHFDEQLQAFRNAGKNVGEVGITTGRKALLNAWAKRGFWLGAGSGAGLTMNDLLSLSQKLDPAEYMGRDINTSSLRKSADADVSENPNNAAAALRSAQGVQAK